MTDESGSLDPFWSDLGFGYVDRARVSPRQFNPQLVLNSASGSVLGHIREELQKNTTFVFSVAFVSPRAIALLKQELLDFPGPGTIVTSDYLGFNSPTAFRELLNLTNYGVDVRLHRETAFHPKGYVFQRPDMVTAILGSSNLTENAMVTNHEWNLKVSASRESDLASQFTNLLDSQLEHSDPLTSGWIDEYERTYVPPPAVRKLPADNGVLIDVVPNAMQTEALEALARTRVGGATRAIVVSATGTGKTILSALDVRQVAPRRVLVVAHREQLLDKAKLEFARILGASDSELGKYVGAVKQLDRRYVFASIQSLTQPGVLESIERDAFDYVLVDEVHRAGAQSYRAVIEHFRPQFLLGITATPERPDGFSLFELFDYNVPYEIRLQAALEADMLAPFHYYGVADLTFEDGEVTSDSTPIARLVSSERVVHILEALEKYGQAGEAPRGLMFCSRNSEARALSAELNTRSLRGRRLRTLSLSGDDSVHARDDAIRQLQAGELDYLLTVDIFNEGVDIPSINQIVMLRQTQSSIVFVQQLGRGLRKSSGKEYVVVIDFIGNYANNYLIPVALFGDDSLNRESVRKNLIAAEEVGVIAGLSSVRFDRIAQERVLRSVAVTKFDSFPNLKSAIDGIRNRLGRYPMLEDFLRFESADPVVLATTRAGSYQQLLAKLFSLDLDLSDGQLRALSLISREVLSSKRLHDVTLLERLLQVDSMSFREIRDLFLANGIEGDPASVASAVRTLTSEFNTEPERTQLGAPIARAGVETIALTDQLRADYSQSPAFKDAVDDLVRTGILVTTGRYDIARPFTRGKQYSRKDASRILRWSTNMASTIYGYKVDRPTNTCPIFVTHKKSDDVSSSTAYEDKLLDPSTMLWFTRSRRTLHSEEVKAIVENRVDLHVFLKQDDAEGADFYYLGEPSAHNAEQAQMRSGEFVVHMQLKFDEPIDAGLYDYFEPRTTRFDSVN